MVQNAREMLKEWDGFSSEDDDDGDKIGAESAVNGCDGQGMVQMQSLQPFEIYNDKMAAAATASSVEAAASTANVCVGSTSAAAQHTTAVPACPPPPPGFHLSDDHVPPPPPPAPILDLVRQPAPKVAPPGVILSTSMIPPSAFDDDVTCRGLLRNLARPPTGGS